MYIPVFLSLRSIRLSQPCSLEPTSVDFCTLEVQMQQQIKSREAVFLYVLFPVISLCLETQHMLEYNCKELVIFLSIHSCALML